ncbi:MAG TPA: L,D-transpeptidase family protein [Solirubrobacteraceae bacterium]|jgi:L,D-peptidoglycan transpeptidase YkuD (ErfK/YbiS/YcfS/YnhG family)|nr:L,D-transpeptidase family protein [Solirubrobacteraceae bacterium]
MARIAAAQIRIGAATTILLLALAASASAERLAIPRRARELVVVSSPTTDPPGSQRLATLGAYARAPRSARWRLVFGPWATETGSGRLVPAAKRREGDHATPIGVFSFGHTIYGTEADPGALHYPYRRLSCGDWWDEDPYSALYNRFVHVPCGASPGFGGDSEALWTETLAYRYFAVIDFDIGPTRGGSGAIGSGIFMHSWVYAATAGCVALPVTRLLEVLRWLRPSQHPVIEIGTDAELARLR